jgi:tetratricopeptide (TPR) repeat protein
VAEVSQLLSLYETTDSLTEAKGALDQIAAMDQVPDVDLGGRYDLIAETAAEYGDYVLAVQAERLAIEHGCPERDLAQRMLGWYLLKIGEVDEGEAVFAAAVKEQGSSPGLHGMIGAARMNAGDFEGALRAFDRALELAEAERIVGSPASARDRFLVDRLRAEREEVRQELGLPAEGSGRFSRAASPFPEAPTYAVAWFPRDAIDTALARWPSLAEDLHDPDAYCGIVEARVREVGRMTGRVPSIAPLKVDALVEFAESRGLDPGTAEARSELAASLASRDEVVPWPPGRNDPCWCGSGRKYKRCCG